MTERCLSNLYISYFDLAPSMEAAADGPQRIFDTRCGGELYVANLIS